MYVAKIGPDKVAKIGPDKYVIKRMPDTGLAHTHRCASYLHPKNSPGSVRSSARQSPRKPTAV